MKRKLNIVNERIAELRKEHYCQKNPNITNKKQCLPSLEKTLHELPPNPSFLQENLDHPSSKGDLTLCKLFKSNKRQTYNDLLCSKRTQLRSRNVPLFSAVRYMNNIKEEKIPELKSSKGSYDS